jgi:hypothetical protein
MHFNSPTILFSRYGYTSVGFTDGNKTANCTVRFSPNYYGIDANVAKIDSFWLSGKEHELECPTGFIAGTNVFGSGLLLNSRNELAVFFTLNGNLLGKLLLTHIMNEVL